MSTVQSIEAATKPNLKKTLRGMNYSHYSFVNVAIIEPVKFFDEFFEEFESYCFFNVWSMKLRVQDQGEDQRRPGKRLYVRTVKHVS